MKHLAYLTSDCSSRWLPAVAERGQDESRTQKIRRAKPSATSSSGIQGPGVALELKLHDLTPGEHAIPLPCGSEMRGTRLQIGGRTLQSREQEARVR